MGCRQLSPVKTSFPAAHLHRSFQQPSPLPFALDINPKSITAINDIEGGGGDEDDLAHGVLVPGLVAFWLGLADFSIERF